MAARIDTESALPHAVSSTVSKGWGGAPRRMGRDGVLRQRMVPRGVWYAVAGVVIAAAGLIAGWPGARSRIHFAAPANPLIYATANGQRATITLPDGSTAALNVGSQLDVSPDYARGNRTLRLTGEAFFTVQHHDGTPFTVIAGLEAVRVLGTSFVVRRYETDTVTRVAVREGKVAVRTAVLTAGRQADVNSAGGVFVRRADPAQFGFTTGVMTLNGVQLRDAIIDLDRWYDADIRLGDAGLASRQITIECATGSIADLAAILQMTFDVRVVRDGRTLTLYAR